MTRRAALPLLLLLLGTWASAAAAVRDVPPGLVTVTARAGADSVTVGQRFTVTVAVVHPDSLRPVPAVTLPEGKTRLLAAAWRDSQLAPGRILTTGVLRLLTLDLHAAAVPALPLLLAAENGDTLRATSPAVTVPVRSLAAPGDSLAPLRGPWSPPRGVPAAGWILLVLAVLGAGWLAWRRRGGRETPAPAPAPPRPPDLVALAALAELARQDLPSRGEFKRYYSGLTDILRRYLADRFGVEALESTSAELLDQLAGRGTWLTRLETLLREADLVKFARHRPSLSAAGAALETARALVTETTAAVSVAPATPTAAAGPPAAAGGGHAAPAGEEG